MAREYTITKGTVECYKIRCATGGEWADNLHKLWDTGPDIQYDISPMFRQFWEKLWPVFVGELKKETES